VLFDITCAEKSSDSTFVVITLEPKKAGDGSTSLYIGLYYKNVQWDPITSTVFISLNTPLEIDFILTGAKLPYDLTLDWGDGVIDRLTNQAEARQTLKHAFTSKGKVTMKFTVVDEFKKTKTASATIEVR